MRVRRVTAHEKMKISAADIFVKRGYHVEFEKAILGHKWDVVCTKGDETIGIECERIDGGNYKNRMKIQKGMKAVLYVPSWFAMFDEMIIENDSDVLPTKDLHRASLPFEKSKPWEPIRRPAPPDIIGLDQSKFISRTEGVMVPMKAREWLSLTENIEKHEMIWSKQKGAVYVRLSGTGIHTDMDRVRSFYHASPYRLHLPDQIMEWLEIADGDYVRWLKHSDERVEIQSMLFFRRPPNMWSLTFGLP